MSHWIEYQIACFAMPLAAARASSPRYLVAIEGGSNNLTETASTGRERRVREWYVGMLGTEKQVLMQAVRAAAACEGGDLRLQGRAMKAEAYIGRVRRCLANARTDFDRHINLSVQVSADHALVDAAKARGYAPCLEQSFGETRARLRPLETSATALQTFFELLDPFIEADQITSSAFGSVFGLPAS